ncbi:MAG: succinylglutamate-semialdehyde dehydrogenase [Verrucomicrobiota bacterium]
MKNYISGKWLLGESDYTVVNHNPSTGGLISEWAAADEAQVDQAIQAAKSSFIPWAATELEERIAILRRFAEIAKDHREELASAIQSEAGKPKWEALQEAQAVAGKVELSIKAYQQRCASFGSAPSKVRFRPHGVLAVIGPFNFPAHLPNGHIVPALIAGNTVVFKPSERVPLAAELMTRYWIEAGLPEGVLNLVQGEAQTGSHLAENEKIDGLLFTGGSQLGEHFRQTYAQRPEKILALELGGNNPLVVWDSDDPHSLIQLILQSAYVTAGQRCTCARRLIVPQNKFGDDLLKSLRIAVGKMRTGSAHQVPEVFMGPVIGASTALKLVEKQQVLESEGHTVLNRLRITKEGTGQLTPGLIDGSEASEIADEEIFGPLLQVRRAKNFEEAIIEANRTRYGLAAGLVSASEKRYQQFRSEVRAGIINWNKPLTGASGAVPFGGIGLSGNHRPSGFFAADYCSYAVASLESPKMEIGTPPPGLALK